MIDFYSPTCPSCSQMDSAVTALSLLYSSQAVIGKVDIQQQDSLASRYGITLVPSFLFFNNGEEARRIVGIVACDSLAQILDSLIAVSS